MSNTNVGDKKKEINMGNIAEIGAIVVKLEKERGKDLLESVVNTVAGNFKKMIENVQDGQSLDIKAEDYSITPEELKGINEKMAAQRLKREEAKQGQDRETK